jgi:signal transduction histidine kinase
LRTTVAAFVAFGAMLMVLTAVASQVVRTATASDRSRRERVAQGAQQIVHLAAASDEEAFSYVVSGDVGERRSFLEKVDSAVDRARDLEREPEIPARERVGAHAVVTVLESLRREAIVLFDTFERTGTVTRERHDAFEHAIDRASMVTEQFEGVALEDYQGSVVSLERSSTIFTLVVGCFALAVFVALGSLLARRMTMPLRLLRDAVRPYRERPSLPVSVRPAGDELAQITEVFEDMVAARARVEAELREAHKLEAVGRVAAGVAHDFNNVLAAVLGCAEVALFDLGPEHPSGTDLRGIIDAATRGTSICRQLLTFGHPKPFAPRRVPINDTIEGVAPMLKRLAGSSVRVRLALDPSGPHIHGDPTQLDQVLMNLVVNARDAMPNGGELVVATEVVAGRVVLSVADTGTGIDAATQRRIFEPFFTTKAVGKGTGLGLATVMRIVREFGGTIEVESALGRGTTFRICLRSADEAREAA